MTRYGAQLFESCHVKPSRTGALQHRAAATQQRLITVAESSSPEGLKLRHCWALLHCHFQAYLLFALPRHLLNSVRHRSEALFPLL